MRRVLVFLISLVLFFTALETVAAQRPEVTKDGILVCVRLASGVTYTLLFRQTTGFGLIVPESGRVTVSAASKLSASLYRIAPDAPSGGYRFSEPIAQSFSLRELPPETNCADQVTTVVAERSALLSTIDFPVNEQRALIIQTDPAAQPPSDILGVLGMELEIEGAVAPVSFQVLQISKVDREIQFRLLSSAERAFYSAVANKLFDLRQSLPDLPNPVPEDFTSLVQASSFSFNVRRFKNPANLYAVLARNKMRIYPAYGLFSVAREQVYIGGFFSIRMDSEKAERLPRLEPNVRVRALPGAVANYYAAAKPDEVLGRLQGNGTATVNKVDEEGRLLVTVGNNRNVIIDAWLVEVVE
ncbi:MAG: hypothetical protein NZ571_05295 [Anaerolineae bacterium]|nr:hypothetical protein [Anaerolineae bacterium]